MPFYPLNTIHFQNLSQIYQQMNYLLWWRYLEVWYDTFSTHVIYCVNVFFLGGCDFHLCVIPTEANGKWRGFALILHFPISNECFCTAHKNRCLSWRCCFHGMDSVSFSTLHVSIIHRNTEYRMLCNAVVASFKMGFSDI